MKYQIIKNYNNSLKFKKDELVELRNQQQSYSGLGSMDCEDKLAQVKINISILNAEVNLITQFISTLQQI